MTGVLFGPEPVTDDVIPPGKRMLHSSAVISGDGLYRYRLSRAWGPSLKTLAFVGLNPSTADGSVDDPTIRRCINFADREECGRLAMFNLYAWRATNPSDLPADHATAVGPRNDVHLGGYIRTAAKHGLTIVCAWGTNASPERVDEFKRLCDEIGGSKLDLRCLAVTKDGHPGHPLYIKADQPLILWPPR